MKSFLEKAKAAAVLVFVLLKDEVKDVVAAVREGAANVLHKIEEFVAP